jgi:iron(III) transport system substrate-binding protein
MRRLLPALAIVALLGAWFFSKSSADALVVYCAHDAIFAEEILREFTARTGIAVATRYDTEATKSLGLTELLLREKDAPRCDVFWNNELLGTLDLQGNGVLAPYRGPGWERIPAKYKDPAGHWTGFAARMRVWMLNTHRLQTDGPLGVRGPMFDTSERVAIAKPLYGTTLTHYSVLWQTLGAEKVKAWHRDGRRRGVRELNGNAAVKDAVAAGACSGGYTDTDDVFAAMDAGAPVAHVPVRLEDGATICIPNTVAIIRGTKREDAARKLVDFLLSVETELALARSKSRQIPLGPVPAEQVPAEVRELMDWAKAGVDLTQLGPARTECLAWLKAEYLR